MTEAEVMKELEGLNGGPIREAQPGDLEKRLREHGMSDNNITKVIEQLDAGKSGCVEKDTGDVVSVEEMLRRIEARKSK